MRDESSRYAYATFGIVAVVALLATWLIIGQTPSFGRDNENLRGQATTSIYPLIITADLDVPFTVGIGTVRLASVSRTDADIWVTYSPDGPEIPRTLPLGGSLPIGSFTVTLMVGDAAGETAEFHISTSTLVCGERDTQESLCRGASACCGGACVELPDCAAIGTDGPVDSCGERPLYCCDGTLGFSACGQIPTVPTCTTHSDCPVITCVQAPCPVNRCIAGTCTEVLETQDPNCLSSGVCFSANILPLVNGSDGDFIGYGTLHDPTLTGEIVNNLNVARYYGANANQEADFLVLFKDWDSPPSAAYYTGVKNDVLGLGGGVWDYSAVYGTTDLYGEITMPNINVLEDSEQYNVEVATLVHEITHRWGVFFDEGTYSLRDGPHYSKCYISGNGYSDPMGSTPRWSEEKPGVFVAPWTPSGDLQHIRFSPLSLYLMGVVPAQDVPNLAVITSDDGYPCTNTFNGSYFVVRGSRMTLTIDDLRALNGNRVPAYGTAPNTYRVQFAIVTHPNSPVTQSQADRYEQYIQDVQAYFDYATFGKAHLEVVPFSQTTVVTQVAASTEGDRQASLSHTIFEPTGGTLQ